MTAATARTVTVSLPLPPASQSANGRAGWRRKAADTKRTREASYYAALAQMPAGWRFQRATLHIRYVVCLANPLGCDGRARPKDLDGVVSAVKAICDGALVDSGLLVDDNATRLLGITPQLDRHTRRTCTADCKGSGVWLTVTEAVN